MTRTHPSPPLLVPVAFLQLARDLVATSYRMRARRSCDLCGRAMLSCSPRCFTCGHAQIEESAPCTACGRMCGEREIEDGRGYCPHCFAPWTGTSERAVLVPYALPAGELDETDPYPF